MQFMPAINSNTNDISALAQESQNSYSLALSKDSRGFSSLLDNYFENSPAEVTPTMLDYNPTSSYTDSNLGYDSSEDFSYSDYEVYDYTNVNINPSQAYEEVRLTESEVNKLADKLEADGVDPEIVHEIRELGENVAGITPSDLAKQIMEKLQTPAEITDKDLQNIFSLMHSISGNNAPNLVDNIRAGQKNTAWQNFTNSLNADPNKLITVNKDDLISFAKGLNLSNDAIQSINNIFGNNSKLTLKAGDLDKLLTLPKQEMADYLKNIQDLAASLDKNSASILQEARIRTEKEKSAFLKSEKSVDQSDILIKDTVTRNGLTANNLEENKVFENSGLKDSLQDAMNKSKDQDLTVKNGNTTDLTSDKNGQDAKNFQGSKDGSEFMFDKKGTAFFESLITRTEVRTDQMFTFGSLLQTSSQLNTGNNVSGAPLTQQQAAQALNQMKSGMLTAMKDGATKLEIQLTPTELGAVNVVLVSRNGEVSAMLRPERAETAQLFNQQADAIKASLEQQGIKVEKVEVQTQLQDNRNNNNWQGTDQHNNAKEQQEMADQQQRALRLGRIGREERESMMSTSDIDESLSDIALNGLHLVA